MELPDDMCELLVYLLFALFEHSFTFEKPGA